MRIVEWKDKEGYMRRRQVKDGDPDELGPLGVPVESPDITTLDWDEIKRDLHNRLMARGLYTFQDVQRSQTGISSVVRAVLTKRIMLLYRELDKLTRK